MELNAILRCLQPGLSVKSLQVSAHMEEAPLCRLCMLCLRA